MALVIGGGPSGMTVPALMFVIVITSYTAQCS